MLVRLKNYMTYNDKKVYCDLACNGHKSTTMIMLKNVQDARCSENIYINKRCLRFPNHNLMSFSSGKKNKR